MTTNVPDAAEKGKKTCSFLCFFFPLLQRATFSLSPTKYKRDSGKAFFLFFLGGGERERRRYTGIEREREREREREHGKRKRREEKEKELNRRFCPSVQLQWNPEGGGFGQLPRRILASQFMVSDDLELSGFPSKLCAHTCSSSSTLVQADATTQHRPSWLPTTHIEILL